MNKIFISLYDSKSESWSNPVVADTKCSALRDFQSLVNRPGTLPGDHPADFDLFMVGKWQQLQGQPRPMIVNCDFEHIANGLDVLNKPRE